MHDDISFIELPARFSSLDTLLGQVETACEAAGVHSDYSRRAELTLEELFSNTIHHAYGGESDRSVWVRAIATTAGIVIEYQDAGPPFDPFRAADGPASGQSPEPSDGGSGSLLIQMLAGLSPEPSADGQGCRLIKQLATRCAYHRVEGRNIVSLEFLRKV